MLNLNLPPGKPSHGFFYVVSMPLLVVFLGWCFVCRAHLIDVRLSWFALGALVSGLAFLASLYVWGWLEDLKRAGEASTGTGSSTAVRDAAARMPSTSWRRQSVQN